MRLGSLLRVLIGGVAASLHVLPLLGSPRRSVVGWGSLGIALACASGTSCVLSLAKGPASLGLSLARPLGRANGPASMGTCTHGPKGIPLLDYLTQSSSWV